MKISIIEFDPFNSDDLEDLLKLHTALSGGVLSIAPSVSVKATRRQTATERTIAALDMIAAQDKAARQQAETVSYVETNREVRDVSPADLVKLTPEQIEADNGAAIDEMLGDKPVSAPEQQEAAAREEMLAAAGALEPPAEEDARSPEELLRAVRERAADEGALFLRRIIKEFNVKGCSALSVDQLREVLSW